MSVDDELLKRDALAVQLEALEIELKSLESGIDYSPIEAKRDAIQNKIDELDVPIAAKEYKELTAKLQSMAKENTYERRYVVAELAKHTKTLVDAKIISEGAK